MSRSFSELKEKVLEANLGLKEAGLVAGTSGNVSGINENRDRVVIKPSGVEFSNLRKDDLSVVDPIRCRSQVFALLQRNSLFKAWF